MSTIYGNSGATQLDEKRPDNTMRSVPLNIPTSPSKASPIIAKRCNITQGKGTDPKQSRGY